MAQKTYLKFLTEDEYWNLTHPGRVLADYWTEYLPKMCAQLKKEGRLYQTIDQMGEELSDLQVELMQDGYPEDGAWEVVKEQIYSLPPEK